MSRGSLIILLGLLISHSGNSRSFGEKSKLVSDGIDKTSQNSAGLELDVTATTVTCEPIYGLLPCVTSVWGQLFMIITYEFLLSLAGRYVSSGSELFFQMFGTGIFGATLFQILGTIPQVALVLAIGVTGSTSTIETLATMGMGLLAGSTIMLLTLVWASVVSFGSYDLSQPSSNSSDEENVKPFSLTGYGVSTDVETYYTARIMMASMIPFLILQLAKILNSTSGERIVVLVSLIVTLVFLFVYCTFQVFQPWIQNRRYEYLTRSYVQINLLPSLLTAGGRPNLTAIREFFQKIDKNRDNFISVSELRALILGIQIEVGLNEDELEAKVMQEFDISGDDRINETEFVKGISKWLVLSRHPANEQDHDRPKFFNRSSKRSKQQSLLTQKQEIITKTQRTLLNYVKAAVLLLVGTATSTLLGLPLMQTLQEFSSDVNIPSFLVTYVLVPLALNIRQALATIASAREKTEKAISLTFSEIYNGVFMNNMMGLVIFLSLVYIRDLSWDVSAEILVVLLICTAMGLFTSFRTKFPFWTSILAYLLYPLSLLIIYVLTEVVG
ncbi:hypothetical protein I3760_10G055100 [Carya illinoinensis]|uniref:EF-hand domain-containing protein n=1 Tax=Carya illinoinensis TaxID=32201 RepID=A0A8T1PB44_CARIL|nr:hypothetical protein I3760_10G055100 [Carya illinoinensis]KAG6638753.1 hypothetical protein CIPAW_10G056100 [Carya illinoinensis]KAG6691216.1 hypothetical protein I3842_10G055200 [Carya illinoinensis]